MICRSFTFSVQAGWSISEFPELDSPSTLVLAFVSSCCDKLKAELEVLREAYPQSIVVGCSTAGEVFAGEVYDDTMAVAVAKFEHTRLKEISVTCGAAGCGSGSAKGLIDQLPQDELQAVMVLAEGSQMNATGMAKALADYLRPSVRVFGGIAGDGKQIDQTWVISRGEIKDNHIAAVGFYGEHLRLGCGSRAGWSPVGPERRVNRSEGKVVHELDGQPALSIYKRYLGDLAEGLPATALMFPLRLKRPDGGPEVVRSVLAVDHDMQTMTFAGEVPEGSLVQLMCGHIDSVVDAAELAGSSAAKQWGKAEPSDDTLSVVVSCIGRRAVLGDRTAEELEGLQETIEATSHQIGFYSHGELAPAEGSACELYNQTLTVAVLSESSPRHAA